MFFWSTHSILSCNSIGGKRKSSTYPPPPSLPPPPSIPASSFVICNPLSLTRHCQWTCSDSTLQPVAGVTWAAAWSPSAWMAARTSSTPAPTAASRWLAGAACNARPRHGFRRKWPLKEQMIATTAGLLPLQENDCGKKKGAGLLIAAYSFVCAWVFASLFSLRFFLFLSSHYN